MVLDTNAVRSVDRAAALLLALGDSQGEAGVTELARRLGLHKSTASRLLATLQRRGLVEQDDEIREIQAGPGRHSTRRAGGADARPPGDRAAGARNTREVGPGDREPGGARRRVGAHRRAGGRAEPGRRRRSDRPIHAAALPCQRQGPHGGARRARGPADLAPGHRPLHGPDDRRSRAIARGAGADQAARVRHGSGRVRSRAQCGCGAGRGRSRRRRRRRRHLGPRVQGHAAPRAGVGGSRSPGGGGNLRPAGSKRGARSPRAPGQRVRPLRRPAVRRSSGRARVPGDGSPGGPSARRRRSRRLGRR